MQDGLGCNALAAFGWAGTCQATGVRACPGLTHCPGPFSFAFRYAGNEKAIPWNEVIVVFDADMCANRDFFLKILEVLLDDSVALCLTPQVGGAMLWGLRLGS
jgi:hypothetical protein